MGYESFYPGPVSRVQGYFFIKKALGALRFVAAQVALWALDPHYFATTGDMKAALSTLMGFKFWHAVFPSSPLLSCLFR